MFSPHQGAISLTFDDGRSTQLEHALPIMNRLDLKGTFYLIPNGVDWRKKLSPWREVARRGHEIGNHSASHPRPPNHNSVEGVYYSDMTLESLESDISKAQSRLKEIAPTQEKWTFCYPCYHTDIGLGLSRKSYIPLIEKQFIAGRGIQEYGFANVPEKVDIACIGGCPCERMSAFEMIGMVEELAVGQKQWVVLVFHDINGDRLTTSKYDFQLLCEYIARRQDDLWCAPVASVACHIRRQRSAACN